MNLILEERIGIYYDMIPGKTYKFLATEHFKSFFKNVINKPHYCFVTPFIEINHNHFIIFIKGEQLKVNKEMFYFDSFYFDVYRID